MTVSTHAANICLQLLFVVVHGLPVRGDADRIAMFRGGVSRYIVKQLGHALVGVLSSEQIHWVHNTKMGNETQPHHTATVLNELKDCINNANAKAKVEKTDDLNHC